MIVPDKNVTPTYKPFVPEGMKMAEFTWRAVLIGLVMTVILGAANAYLGLKAGQTIAATYPAAVIGMAVLRVFKGSILEENIARTAGSIGESVAAGAIFTIPAFVLTKSWPVFNSADSYWKSTALMTMGGILGVLFVSLVRRVMVEDPELPFPESLAAAQIHKAGQIGSQAAKYLFYNMAFGGAVYLLGAFGVFAPDKNFLMALGGDGGGTIRLGGANSTRVLATGGMTTFSMPTVSPAYVGVGYVIGPKLASLNFSGSILAWGMLIPMLIYFLGPQFRATIPGADQWSWGTLADRFWRDIVRPIAVGGMMIGAAYTLFRMRKSLGVGLGKAFAELRGARRFGSRNRAPRAIHELARGACRRWRSLRRDDRALRLSFRRYAGRVCGRDRDADRGILFRHGIWIPGGGHRIVQQSDLGLDAIDIDHCRVAAGFAGCFRDERCGGRAWRRRRRMRLVGRCGRTAPGFQGWLHPRRNAAHHSDRGIDRGSGRERRDVFSADAAASGQHQHRRHRLRRQSSAGTTGRTDGIACARYRGRQYGMAADRRGHFPRARDDLVQVKSPMLVAIGMYLPLGTTFAIFIGGIIRWITDTMCERRGYNEAQRARVENVGVLAASGLIAGEALMGLVTSGFNLLKGALPSVFAEPMYLAGVAVLLLIGYVLVKIPLANAGRPEDPAPPVAIV